MAESTKNYCELCGRKIREDQFLCSDCQLIEESEDDRLGMEDLNEI